MTEVYNIYSLKTNKQHVHTPVLFFCLYLDRMEDRIGRERGAESGEEKDGWVMTCSTELQVGIEPMTVTGVHSLGTRGKCSTN